MLGLGFNANAPLAVSGPRGIPEFPVTALESRAAYLYAEVCCDLQ